MVWALLLSGGIQVNLKLGGDCNGCRSEAPPEVDPRAQRFFMGYAHSFRWERHWSLDVGMGFIPAGAGRPWPGCRVSRIHARSLARCLRELAGRVHVDPLAGWGTGDPVRRRLAPVARG